MLLSPVVVMVMYDFGTSHQVKKKKKGGGNLY